MILLSAKKICVNRLTSFQDSMWIFHFRRLCLKMPIPPFWSFLGFDPLFVVRTPLISLKRLKLQTSNFAHGLRVKDMKQKMQNWSRRNVV